MAADKEHGGVLKINSIIRAELLHLKGPPRVNYEIKRISPSKDGATHVKISCYSQGRLWLAFVIEMC